MSGKKQQVQPFEKGVVCPQTRCPKSGLSRRDTAILRTESDTTKYVALESTTFPKYGRDGVEFFETTNLEFRLGCEEGSSNYSYSKIGKYAHKQGVQRTASQSRIRRSAERVR